MIFRPFHLYFPKLQFAINWIKTDNVRRILRCCSRTTTSRLHSRVPRPSRSQPNIENNFTTRLQSKSNTKPNLISYRKGLFIYSNAKVQSYRNMSNITPWIRINCNRENEKEDEYDYIEHQIRSDDTLEGLAIQYNVSKTVLKALNKLANDEIFYLKRIIVPQSINHN